MQIDWHTDQNGPPLGPGVGLGDGRESKRPQGMRARMCYAGPCLTPGLSTCQFTRPIRKKSWAWLKDMTGASLSKGWVPCMQCMWLNYELQRSRVVVACRCRAASENRNINVGNRGKARCERHTTSTGKSQHMTSMCDHKPCMRLLSHPVIANSQLCTLHD